MDKDPIVEEVRKAGERIAEKCGFDADLFIAHLRKNQNKSRKKIVSFSKRAKGSYSFPAPDFAGPGSLKCAEEGNKYQAD